jgi:hypothetical protein
MFSPDRGHIHHRLIDHGITHRRAVITLYGASIVLAASAVAIALGRNWEIGLGLLGACVVLIGLMRAVGQIEWSRLSREGGTRDPRTGALKAALPKLLVDLRRVDSSASLQTALEELRRASRVEYAAITSDEVVVVEAGRAEEPMAGFLSLPVGTEHRLVFRDDVEISIGPRSEALLELWADQAAFAVRDGATGVRPSRSTA